METLFVVFQFVVILSLVGTILLMGDENRKQIKDLTNKLVAKSLTEYGQVKQMEDKPVIVEKKTEKKHVDPVLGSHY